MTYYYVLKDGLMQMRTVDKDEAIDYIHQMQKYETHYLLRSEFSIIEGKAEEFVKYEI